MRQRLSKLLLSALLALALGLSVLGVHRGLVERGFTAAHRPVGQVVGAAGERVHLVERGRDGVPVVLLHGNPGTALDFARVQDALGVVRSLALDRPGYGFSERATQPMPPAAQAEALRSAVRGLGVERVVLAGFSYGGPVALAWAAAHPDEVSALVLVAAVGSPKEDLGISDAQALLARPLVGELFAWTVAPLVAPGVVEERYASFFSPSPVDAEALARGRLFFARPPALISSASDWMVLATALPALAERYPSLHLPVEILCGDGDRSVSPEHSRYLAAHLPAAHLREVAGAGHGLLYTHTATVVAAILRARAR